MLESTLLEMKTAFAGNINRVEWLKKESLTFKTCQCKLPKLKCKKKELRKQG